MSVMWSDASAVWRDSRFVNVVLFRDHRFRRSLVEHFYVAESIRHRRSEGYVFDLRHVEEEYAISNEVCAIDPSAAMHPVIAFVVRSPWTMLKTNCTILFKGQWAYKRLFMSRHSAKKWLTRHTVQRKRDAARCRIDWIPAMKPYVS